MLNRRLKSWFQQLLPGFALAWIDPVEETIRREVRAIARETRAGEVVLDAGAGESRHRPEFNHARYVALDSGRGDPAWNYSGLDVLARLEQLPLRSGSVDHVLCIVVLEHTPRPQQVLEEFARVLRPGGTLLLVVPFLWEEHQIPNDFFRFTRFGVRSLLESSCLRVDAVKPIGGFFWVCARRCVNALSFFQRGWRWILFALFAPFFGLLFPALLYFLDFLDQEKRFSLGFQVRATRE